MQLCDAFGLPIVSLCDTPASWSGPSMRRPAWCACLRMFVVGGALSVPIFTVVLRKGYGLGAQADGGGSFHAAVLHRLLAHRRVRGMGLEGAARLGYRKDSKPSRRPKKKNCSRTGGPSYAGQGDQHGGVSRIDAVIDPADTAAWILRATRACRRTIRASGGRF